MPHGVTFNFDSDEVCSPAIFETSFSYDKDVGMGRYVRYREHFTEIP